MKVHVLQHVPFEGLGSIWPWLVERRAEVDWTRFYEPVWSFPCLDDVDLVIALGGPMSVNDEAALPWLVEEKQFIREAVQQGVAVLGICLGAQLIASALGAKIYPGAQKEIGWFDITATEAATDVFRFPQVAKVFHWHGETFDLPAGAVGLARSAVCKNQAFQLGRNVIGLQFHLETTPESAESMIAHCGDELIEARYVQTAETIRSVPPGHYASINQLMGNVLSFLSPTSA